MTTRQSQWGLTQHRSLTLGTAQPCHDQNHLAETRVFGYPPMSGFGRIWTDPADVVGYWADVGRILGGYWAGCWADAWADLGG